MTKKTHAMERVVPLTTFLSIDTSGFSDFCSLCRSLPRGNGGDGMVKKIKIRSLLCDLRCSKEKNKCVCVCKKMNPSDDTTRRFYAPSWIRTTSIGVRAIITNVPAVPAVPAVPTHRAAPTLPQTDRRLHSPREEMTAQEMPEKYTTDDAMLKLLKMSIRGVKDAARQHAKENRKRIPQFPLVPTSEDIAKEEPATKDGFPFLVYKNTTVQCGSFNSLMIRLAPEGMANPDPKDVQDLLNSAIAVNTILKDGTGKKVDPIKSGAVYCGIPESLAGYTPTSSGSNQTTSKSYTDYLKAAGFLFYTTRGVDPDDPKNNINEFLYVNDIAAMVPAYATSIEGVTAVLLSPDEKNILSVWERGSWNTPGGAVDRGENKYIALEREVREEVGVALDPEFKDFQYLGGWQVGKARDGVVNDNFSVFVVKANDTTFQIDEKEISQAAWIPWKPCLKEWRDAGRPSDERHVKLDSLKPYEQVKDKITNIMSLKLLRWLDMYDLGKGLPCKYHKPGSEEGGVGGKVELGVYKPPKTQSGDARKVPSVNATAADSSDLLLY